MNPTRSASARLRRKKLKRLAMLLMNLTLYPLSALFPRSNNRWAFGHSRELFAGNPKYLFLWMALNRPDIHISWITGSESIRRMLMANGHRAYRRWSPQGLYAALRAGVFIYAHNPASVNVHGSWGPLLVNLWHGVGLKSIQFGYEGGGTSFLRKPRLSAFARLQRIE